MIHEIGHLYKPEDADSPEDRAGEEMHDDDPAAMGEASTQPGTSAADGQSEGAR